MIMSDSKLSGQAITNPECMKDCFATAASGRRRSGKKGRKNKKKGRKGGRKGRQTSDSDSNCLALLIDDVMMVSIQQKSWTSGGGVSCQIVASWRKIMTTTTAQPSPSATAPVQLRRKLLYKQMS